MRLFSFPAVRKQKVHLHLQGNMKVQHNFFWVWVQSDYHTPETSRSRTQGPPSTLHLAGGCAYYSIPEDTWLSRDIESESLRSGMAQGSPELSKDCPIDCAQHWNLDLNYLLKVWSWLGPQDSTSGDFKSEGKEGSAYAITEIRPSGKQIEFREPENSSLIATAGPAGRPIWGNALRSWALIHSFSQCLKTVQNLFFFFKLFLSLVGLASMTKDHDWACFQKEKRYGWNNYFITVRFWGGG